MITEKMAMIIIMAEGDNDNGFSSSSYHFSQEAQYTNGEGGDTSRVNSRVDFHVEYEFQTRSGFKGHNVNASVGCRSDSGQTV